MPSGRVNIQLMQCGQKKWRVAPCSPPITGSPAVTSNPSAGIAALSEKALAIIRWQPVQWQAIVTSGGAVTLQPHLPAAAAALPRQPPVVRNTRINQDEFLSSQTLARNCTRVITLYGTGAPASAVAGPHPASAREKGSGATAGGREAAARGAVGRCPGSGPGRDGATGALPS